MIRGSNMKSIWAPSQVSQGFISPPFLDSGRWGIPDGYMSLFRCADRPQVSGKAYQKLVGSRGSECNACWKQTVSRVVTESVVGDMSTETALNPRTRRLILLRHAKSSWEDRSLKDHDRPLSKHGRLAAIDIAGKLQQMGWLPELILSSDAARTRETLTIMQEHVRDFLEAEVHYVGSFYSVAAMDGQTAQHLQQTICQYSRDDMLTIMCMGHNRGWEEAASVFSGVPVELKTSNAALLEASGKSWEEAFNSAGFGGWKLVGVIKPDKLKE